MKDFDPITSAEVMTTLAYLCGIGPEVEALLAGKTLPPAPKLPALLRAKRESMGWTLNGMGRKSGMARSQIEYYERGAQIPQARSIGMVADAYELDVGMVMLAALNSSGMLKHPKPLPRKRIRTTKPSE